VERGTLVLCFVTPELGRAGLMVIERGDSGNLHQELRARERAERSNRGPQ